MWTTFALAVTLGLAAQPGQLTLLNARVTYGPQGVTRAPGPRLPGDSLDIAFDIDGLTVDPSGKARYSATLTVHDAGGKLVYSHDTPPQDTLIPLGGSRLPAHMHLDLGLKQPPGEYTIALAVKDEMN